MKGRTSIAFLVMWVSLLLLAALLSPSPGRASSGSNLLQNPGFEEGTEGWLADSPTTTEFITVTQPVNSGEWAASIKKTAGAGFIYIYQDVPVVGGFRYRLCGWVYNYKDSPIEDWAVLRIEWRDPSGEIALPIDSLKVYDDESGYQERCIPYNGSDGVQAPPTATTARIKCIAWVHDSQSPPPVFFDDLSFTWQGWKVYLPLVMKNQ